MKIRNGFVSNSSSSSFIVNYPKDYISLRDVEDYFGGYNKDIPQVLRDRVTYLLWLNQPNLNDDDKKIYRCKFTDVWERRRAKYGLLDEGNEDNSRWVEQHCDLYYDDFICEECPYKVEVTEEEHLKDIMDNTYYGDEWMKAMEGFKDHLGRVRRFDVANNSDDARRGLDYEGVNLLLNYSDELFKSNKNILAGRD